MGSTGVPPVTPGVPTGAGTSTGMLEKPKHRHPAGCRAGQPGRLFSPLPFRGLHFHRSVGGQHWRGNRPPRLPAPLPRQFTRPDHRPFLLGGIIGYQLVTIENSRQTGLSHHEIQPRTCRQ